MAANQIPPGLLSFVYHLSFDADTQNAVKQQNGLEEVMDQFALPQDIQNLFRNIEQAGQVRETDRAMIASLLSAYISANYNEVYEGIW
jgi:hypothetical protein